MFYIYRQYPFCGEGQLEGIFSFFLFWTWDTCFPRGFLVPFHMNYHVSSCFKISRHSCMQKTHSETLALQQQKLICTITCQFQKETSRVQQLLHSYQGLNTKRCWCKSQPKGINDEIGWAVHSLTEGEHKSSLLFFYTDVQCTHHACILCSSTLTYLYYLIPELSFSLLCGNSLYSFFFIFIFF